MNKHDIATLIHFNFWGNGRILAACQKLTTEEFTREVTPDPGWTTLRAILAHALDAEYGWRSVLQDQDANIILEASDFADVAALKTRWEVERAAWLDYLSSLTDERLHHAYGKDAPNGPKVWQTIMHVVMHSHQHRAEAAWILTGYGYSPGELDFGIFLKENPEFILA